METIETIGNGNISINVEIEWDDEDCSWDNEDLNELPTYLNVMVSEEEFRKCDFTLYLFEKVCKEKIEENYSRPIKNIWVKY